MADGIDLDLLRQWIGRERCVDDAMSIVPARALAAALDHAVLPNAGDIVPPAWHWLYFLETPRASMTGADGHPSRGDFLPPVPLPRRMWAGGAMHRLHPLRLGTPAHRRSTVRAIDAKSGKSGDLIFVTVDHVIAQGGRDCIVEQQDLVYRALPSSLMAQPPGETASPGADWERIVHPGPVLLFRYSALTFNAHRIHYDRPYATVEEQYPALVVHGPLLATLLLDLAAERLPDASIAMFRFRAQRPTFDNAPFHLNGRKEADTVHLWTTDGAGVVGMNAVATLASGFVR